MSELAAERNKIILSHSTLILNFGKNGRDLAIGKETTRGK
jgi:hypothetical protein